MANKPEDDEETQSGRRLFIMLVAGMVMILVGITAVFLLVP